MSLTAMRSTYNAPFSDVDSGAEEFKAHQNTVTEAMKVMERVLAFSPLVLLLQKGAGKSSKGDPARITQLRVSKCYNTTSV